MSCLPARGACRRPGVLRLGLPAAALGAGLLAAAPAAADSASANVRWANSPTIVVESDGSAYTKVAPTAANITGTIGVDINADRAGRVLRYLAWPELRQVANEHDLSPSDIREDFKDSGQGKSYSRPRPKIVGESFTFAISRQQYTAFVVAACNRLAHGLRGQGLSNSEIFAQDREADVLVRAEIETELSGPGGEPGPNDQQLDYGRKLTVTCRRAPQVEQATLAARGDASVSGACSLKLSGMIRTNLANTAVQFRYRSDDGRQSDLKTVVTNHNGAAPISDQYPLSEGGIRSGKVRVVGENLDFSSDWADYEVECGGPAQDMATVLPPEVVRLHTYEIGETLHRGLLCPAKVEIHGVLRGRGTASGGAELFAAGESKAQELYAIEEGQSIIVKAQHTLIWGPTQAQQSVKFTMLVINKQGDLVDQMEETQNFACREPETLGDAQGTAGDLGSTAPEGPDLSLSLATTGQTTVGSFACPATLTAAAKVKANDAMDLLIAHHLEQPSIVIGQNSQAKEQTFSFVKNQNETFPQSFDLNWQGLHSAAGRPLQQPVKMTVRLAKDGFVVAEQQKTLLVTCEGSVAGGQAAADTQQSRPAGSAIGRLVKQQAENFAIQAPKGLVRQGEIRLSGGAADGKYKLTFLRKNGGGYVAVNAAQLPKQMTGLVASFPLKALTGGGEWRIEVCPDGRAPTACKAADFRLTRIGGAGAANAPSPSPAQPQGTVIVLPGLGR